MTREKEVDHNNVCVKLDGADYTWGMDRQRPIDGGSKLIDLKELESKETVLEDISLDLGPESLLVVVGQVGSGKTSLLHSIMDETEKLKGEHVVRGRVAYVEQEPFIYSATIEDNIVFGLEFSEARYNKAVLAASLERDLPNFPNGWKTIIGDRGINISGGQKARISLARAIYQDADIYLLDDPLSAVDPAVANDIFDKGILTALKHKCVILVTHQLQFLRRSPQILLLKNKTGVLGNFDEITA